MIGFVKEQLPLKRSYNGETLGGGGSDLPPPKQNRVKRAFHGSGLGRVKSILCMCF